MLREFKETDIPGFLDIVDNNKETLEGLDEAFPYNKEYTRGALKLMLDNESVLRTAYEKGGEMIGFSLGLIHPSLWDDSVIELSELALNTSTLVPKVTQARVQLALWTEMERLARARKVTRITIAALNNYRMGERFMKKGYTKIAGTFTKEFK